jgi:hypothetical protein
MAQRITQQREIYVRKEVAEGVDPALLVVQGGEDVPWAGTDAILVSNLTLGTDRQYNSRQFTGAFGARRGVMSIQPDPTISFTCELRGGNTVKTPEIDLLWKSVLGPTPQDDGVLSRTVNASPTPTATVFTASADASIFTVGNAIAVETPTADKYEIGWIASKVGNAITLANALSFVPAAGADLKPSLTYKLSDTGHFPLTFRIWLDGSNYIMFNGCKGSVKIDAPAPGAVPTATFSFKAMSWNHALEAEPSGGPVYDSTVASTYSKFKIGDSFPELKAGSWDLGQVVAKKMSQNASNGSCGHVVTNRDLKGTLQLYDMNEDQFTAWKDGTEAALAQQFGDTQHNLVGYQIPKAQRVKVAYGDDGGLTTDAVDFQGTITSNTGNDELKLAYL